jgi:hypothetical protein
MNAQPNASLHASGSQSVFVEFEKFQSYEFDLVCHHSVTHHNFSLSKGDNLKSKLFQLLVFSALMYMGLCLIN